ncbi:hypothetical protein H2204_000555 [Knufia peltigerae]|uniref:Uncharacterized protein n=1 Tax=Knufia peltigerae TaxID=1002370 RepID=A0AA39D360_9EURO|nr:hypothetical protein H2204_000555 [Knufia peltigerae]
MEATASDPLPADVQKAGAKRGHLAINPTLANRHCLDHDLPTATTTTSATASTQSGVFLERFKQKHFNYDAESSQYWAGRYLSVCDRIRSEPLMNTKLLPPFESSTKTIDMLFDARERARIRLALDELRRCCMTDDALESFEHFEVALLKKLGISHQSLYRDSKSLSGASDAGSRPRMAGCGGRKSGTTWNESQPFGSTSTSTSRVSSINAEAVMGKASRGVEGKGTLAKSKTTGNLASFIPKFASRQLVPFIKTTYQSNSTDHKVHHRRISHVGHTPESAEQTIEGRESHTASQMNATHWRSGSRIPSFSLANSESRSLQSLSTPTATPPAEKERSLIFGKKIQKRDQVVGSLDCAMMESGHTMPPYEEKSQAFFPQVQMVTVQGEKEKVIRSRRKSERQSSGEIVKNLFGAGVREVRKMGRRVGAMSIGSSDDLPASKH